MMVNITREESMIQMMISDQKKAVHPKLVPADPKFSPSHKEFAPSDKEFISCNQNLVKKFFFIRLS
jgi:hypothetical protein